MVRTILKNMLSQDKKEKANITSRKLSNQRCTNKCSGPHTPYHKWFAPFCDNHDDCYKCVSPNKSCNKTN